MEKAASKKRKVAPKTTAELEKEQDFLISALDELKKKRQVGAEKAKQKATVMKMKKAPGKKAAKEKE